MNESLGLVIKVVDSFGFLCENYSLDLVHYSYDRRSYSNFLMYFEGNELLLRLTLEKGQLYLHVASPLLPEEWHSLHRVLRVAARHGEEMTAEEQNCDYWRLGRGLESQFSLAARQLNRVVPRIVDLFRAKDFDAVRQELKSYARPRLGDA